ncbi:MAG: valine--tRNA ligase [Bacteriovoracaceae bacterium]|jgi:valyl-tRNA synthetase|nr:valine--tRNA ligase [Bacteriovoracaceae bacterium]
MAASDLPKKYNNATSEENWGKKWALHAVYQYNPNVDRSQTYVIDTPPPTVSGSLHMGHVFSYTQTDIVARYMRMTGKNIFYPIGWDDNGLPTERRVQSMFCIRCNPQLPYDPEFKPKNAKGGKKTQKEVSRQNFLEACKIQTASDEIKYEGLWKHLGLSFDWNQQYATIDEHCRKVSQNSFLDLVDKNHVYSSKAPTMWDTTFQTAVAQAEVEDREKHGHYHDIKFKTDCGEELVISTTRPELLAACICVVAHPDDERFQHLFGKFAITPVFHSKVPILKAEHADPDKGTGILMVCTFGDSADVDFWKTTSLPLKQIIGRGGKLVKIEFGKEEFASENPKVANSNYQELVGLYAKQARKKMVELLGDSLCAEPKPTEQIVKFYEKGDEPLEFISTRQWFIKILENKNTLVEQGKKVKWHPEHMFKRYEQWVEGLNQDWCISRQRFFGVPFPVWYKLDAQGEPDYDNPIFASKEQLPLDPQVTNPVSYSEEQRGQPNGFMADPDVMDTWATSSVSPQISSHWKGNDGRHAKLFPADLRPQAHEIIRTWAFYTITKSWMHEDKIPWHNIAISGWVVNPDKKKMSKSKGDTVTPDDLLKTYSADALRYWAGKARLGNDTVYDESVFKVGLRLTTKIFNASKFVLMQMYDKEGKFKTNSPGLITEPVDVAWIRKMNLLISQSTAHFEKYDYAIALSQTESSFWDFCDFYLELTKTRAYKQKEQASGQSALATLEHSLRSFIKLFAPFVPYVTEEVWNFEFSKLDGESPFVHSSLWPCAIELNKNAIESKQLIDLSKEVLNKARGLKSSNQKSLRWPINSMFIKGTAKDIDLIKLVESDIILSTSLKQAPTYQVLEQKPEESFFSIEMELSETKE